MSAQAPPDDCTCMWESTDSGGSVYVADFDCPARPHDRTWVASEPVCEVCHSIPVEGVYSVPAIPYSAAYCSDCKDAGAHPWHLLVANTAMIGSLDMTAPWWRMMVESTCERLGRSLAEFEKDVQGAIREEGGPS